MDIVPEDGIIMRAQDPVPDTMDSTCPRCGTEMEPIEPSPQGPPVQELQLCPNCYLVIWSDQQGLHLQQGVPMKEGVSIEHGPGEDGPGEDGPDWPNGRGTKC